MAEFFDISLEQIEVIKELWEKNRLYHENNSAFFKESYRDLIFEQRMEGFKGYSSEDLKITVAREDEGPIGYCISTIEAGKGELASLHVEEAKRGTGIGKALAECHLAWMREKDCHAIGVTVSPENETTIGFYRKLGFFPNALYMQIKK